MSKEPIAWITRGGKHIPIFEDDKITNNQNMKEEQIAKNAEQARQLNNQELPRQLRLANIPAREANKASDILNLGTGKRYKFADDSEIRNVYVFAGKGTSKEFRDARKYAARYGGQAKDWQHCTGQALITDGSITIKREVHWVQGKDGLVREAFIKWRPRNNN